MNEKMQYAAMLDIPASTCSITLKPKKRKIFSKKRSKSPEEIKKQLLDKVNSESAEENNDVKIDRTNCETTNEDVDSSVVITKAKKAKIKGGAIAFIVMGALIAIIFLTTAFYPNSGINVFINSIFKNDMSVAATDDRTFDDFTPIIVFSGSKTTGENGITDLSGKGSVYSVADGKVACVTKSDDGKFSVTIKHSDKFSSMITGLDYAYALEGDSVYANIPVGYVVEKGSLSFMDGESVITDYHIVDNTVVWGV